MNNLEQVETIKQTMLAEGAAKPEIIRQLALACIGWPYVFGAWGEECTPANRKRRARAAHPTIVSACQCLRDTNRKSSCDGCKWYPDGFRVRMSDCRGFTRWLMQQVGLDIVNSAGKACQTVTNQYNAAGNWQRRGPINEMPDCVCNVFDLKHGHTGMHIGGGTVVDCSVNVRISNVSDYTNYAIHKGLYSEGEIPVDTIKPTLRRGSRGADVTELQQILSRLGYNPGTADGIFGTKTFNALVAFQTDAKLDPDGVCGPKTWRALAEAEARMPAAPGDGGAASGAPTAEPDEVTYRVTASGVTWAQYRKILEICPLAEAEKE